MFASFLYLLAGGATLAIAAITGTARGERRAAALRPIPVEAED